MQCDPRRPWRGKAFVEQRPGGTIIILRSCNETGTEIDFDSNASAIINQPGKQLFKTEDEAADAYIDAMTQHIIYLMNGVTSEMNSLRQFIAERKKS